MGKTYKKQLQKDAGKAKRMLEPSGLNALFTIMWENYEGFPEIPQLVRVFTASVLTGLCSVTEFMRNIGEPTAFVKGQRFRRISTSNLYKAYKLFFTTETEVDDSEHKIESRKRFTEILRINGYVVRRKNYCRAEVQGIKLNVPRLKAIFEKSGQINFEA